MTDNIRFNIVLRRKIPFVSSILGWILMLLLLILVIFYIIFMPSDGSSDEMSTVYLMSVIPEFIMKIFFWSGLSFLIILTVYYRARLAKSAVFDFSNNTFRITGDNIHISIPLDRVLKIYLNDLHDLRRRPKEKLQVVIDEGNDKMTSFLLKNYEDAGEFIDFVGQLEGTPSAFYKDNLVTGHEHE